MIKSVEGLLMFNFIYNHTTKIWYVIAINLIRI